MPSKVRLQRIADRIQQELSQLILVKTSDPRLNGIFITGARVDRELAYADIFVSAVEGSERSEEVLNGLKHAGGFLRHELAGRVDLRVMPRLRFHWDPTPENADNIERLLATLHDEAAPIVSEDEGEEDDAE
jgi:ribosome-binding factor A